MGVREAHIGLLQLFTWLLPFIVAAPGVEAGTGQGDTYGERIGESAAEVIQTVEATPKRDARTGKAGTVA